MLNSAVSFGGALYASQLESGPTQNGVTFSSNTAKVGGAGNIRAQQL